MQATHLKVATLLASVLVIAGPMTARSAKPSEAVLPSASSSVETPPATDAGDVRLPASFTTEEVEPGVLRVSSDGHRELSRERQDDEVFVNWGEYARTHEDRQVVAAPDGAVWVLDDTGMFEVGKAKTRSLTGEPPVRGYDDVEIAPDGTIWRVGTPTAGLSTLHSFNGTKWRRDHLPGVAAFAVEVRPNGTVWATWAPPVGADPQGLAPAKLGRWDGREWTTFDLRGVQAAYGRPLAVTGRNEVWLCCRTKSSGDRQRLVHFDGRRFRVVADPAPQAGRPDAPVLIDASPDGTLWMRRSSSTLARHDDRGWTVFTSEADGVPQMGWMPEGTGGFLRAAADGGVWVSTTTSREPPDDWAAACDGVAHFDGESWRRYLADMCVFAIDVDPDGRAWVQASLQDTGTSPAPVVGEPVEPIQTFVIDPASRG